MDTVDIVLAGHRLGLSSDEIGGALRRWSARQVGAVPPSEPAASCSTSGACPGEGRRMRIILCAGEHGRAVLIGDVEAEPVPGEPVRLTDCRMVLYWAAECGGLLGLAARGPRGSTRITAAASTVVETTWQEWVAVTPEAAVEVDRWPAC